MSTVFDIIRFPHITEKSTLESEQSSTQVVTFKVHPRANKHQIKEAVEKAFDVEVANVRTASFRGKIKRQGRFAGRRPNWKKAYVKLKAGHKIEFFEGV